jgi:diguanylate cyclase (GGDEF)-like protein
MTDALEAPSPASASAAPLQGILRDALIESRHRWQHFVGLAADLAFETDAAGRFVFMMPEAVLGWPSGSLIGEPSDGLVADDVADTLFNPFRPAMEVRRRRAWIRRFDGGLALMTISTVPLRDEHGVIVGARGVGIDMTDDDSQTALIAGRLRRAELLGHILARVGQEAGADAMMDAALWALIRALGAEGAAVIGRQTEALPIEILHESGPGASAVLPTAAELLANETCESCHAVTLDGQFLLAVACRTRFGPNAGLAIWRNAMSRPWDQDDKLLAESSVTLVRMILDYEAVAREMVHKATTDPLTGLLNRRAFLDEVQRHVTRLDRGNTAGSLMFVDLDAFKAVNDRLGHAEGDKVLVKLADLLRRLVRPGDLVGRLGGDEFAVWLGGADHLTAAERADSLCKAAPIELQAPLPEAFPHLGVSIGIATRRAGCHEPIADLTRRADMAMYQVKRNGRHHWHVSLSDGD